MPVIVNAGNLMQVQATILGMGKKSEPKVRKALQAGAQVLMQLSEILVPVETGALFASRRIETYGTGLAVQVDLIYGGPTAPYVIYVHEDQTKSHGLMYNIKHATEIANGTLSARKPEEQSKFLETPLRNDIDKIRAAIEKELL